MDCAMCGKAGHPAEDESAVVNFEADVALQPSGGNARWLYGDNLKVPPAREAENWEAGRIPALPPQRWWS
jgi:hypothetical protein